MRALRLPVHDRTAADRYLARHPRPGLFILQMLHDDDCPAIRTKRDADCRAPCCPDFYLIELAAAPVGGLN